MRFSVFEFAVNAGLKKAIKIAQLVLGVSSDGLLGPKTLNAINNYNSDLFIVNFSLSRIRYYLYLANKYPKRYGINLRGWLNRVFEGLMV